MAKLLITYDLNAPGKDYKDLYEYLEALDGVRALESVWFVDTNKTTATIRDEIKAVVDSSDVVFVCGISGWASLRVPKVATDKLKA